MNAFTPFGKKQPAAMMTKSDPVQGFMELLNYKLGKPYDPQVLAEFLTSKFLERVDYQ